MYQVSVIIPIYKAEQYIEQCAHSLFKQSLQAIEFIFVNDCSPDKSIEILESILKQYPNRIAHTKIIHHKYNRGSAAARNTGRATAQGEYVIDCDSDDWVDSNMYEIMYTTAKEKDADIAICDWEEIYPSTVRSIHINPPTDNYNCVVALLSGKMHGSLVNKLVKRSLYTKYNISCREDMNFCEDIYVTYRLFYFANSIAYINSPLYHYNKTNPNSYTSNQLSKSSQQGLITLSYEVNKFFREQNENREAIKKAIQYFVNNIKSSILLNGNISFAQQIEKTTISSILSHPTLPILHKIVLILYYIKFIMGIKFIKYIYHKLK